jgi:DNA-binding transcriptional LysR family regulator
MNNFKNITLQQLEGLIALMEAGSYTRAATHLFLSQSTLTKQIQNMEDAAGTKFVNRGSAGISLTPEGRILYDYAKRLSRLRDEASDRIARLKDQDSGHIHIVASTTPATYILPQLLQQILPLHPDIRVHIQMHDSDEALQTVLSNQAEIGFIGKETANAKIVSTRLCRDKLLLIVSPQHRLARQPSVTIAELAREAFIVREHGSGTQAIFDDFLQQQGGQRLSRFNVICEMGSTEAVKEAILAGIGIAILSFFAVRRELEQGSLIAVEIADCSLERYFYIIYRRNFPLRKHHLLFLEGIKQLSASLTI